MAVTFAEGVNRGESLYHAYPEDILIEPSLNGRHDETSVEELAADIEAHGQDTPVLIYKNDAGKAVLVAGHRRYRAIALLNSRGGMKRKLVCRNISIKKQEQAFERTVSENRFRKDVSPMDDALNIHTFMSVYGYTVEDVMRVYSPEAKTPEELKEAKRFVNQRISLYELTPEAAEQLRSGKMKITTAVGLAKLSKDLQKEKLKRAAGEKLKVKDVVPSGKAAGTVKATPLTRAIQAILEEVGSEEAGAKGETFEFYSISSKSIKALRKAIE